MFVGSQTGSDGLNLTWPNEGRRCKGRVQSDTVFKSQCDPGQWDEVKTLLEWDIQTTTLHHHQQGLMPYLPDYLITVTQSL